MEITEEVIELPTNFSKFNWINITMWGEAILIILGCVLLAILSVFFVMKIIELSRKLKRKDV